MGMMEVTELLLLLENRATAMERTAEHGEGEVVVYIAPCRDEHCPCKGRTGEMTVYDPTEELSHRFVYGLGPNENKGSLIKKGCLRRSTRNYRRRRRQV